MKYQIFSILFLITINLYKASKFNLRLITCDYSYLNILNFLNLPTSSQQNIDILGSAAVYAVLAGSTTTNANQTTIVGSLGVSPLTSIAGTAVTLIGGSFHAGDPHALLAQGSLTYAYNLLAGLAKGTDLSGIDLMGLVLLPGHYGFTSCAFLSAGILTLNANGNANAEWVFQIGSTLITRAGAQVQVIGGGSPFNVYWQVGSSATISENTKMVGNIIALASISFEINATLKGRALARNGAVTMDSNFIASVPCI